MGGLYQLDKIDAFLPLKGKAYAAIKEAILSLKLRPGMPLVESELAQQLGISKTPVRDALQELEREGFVTRILFKGTYVTEVTTQDLVEVFQLRAVLEGLAARLATPLLSDAEAEELAETLAASEAALARRNLALCSELGRKIHSTLIDRADNQRLQQIIANLDDHMRRFRNVADQISGRLDKSMKEYRRLVEAIRRRDAIEAERAMRDHLSSVLHDLTVPVRPAADA